MRIETILAQLDHYLDHASAGVVPPIQPSTTYARHPNNELLIEGRVYGRDQNPGHALVEQIIAKLEGGQASMLLPSGQAAGLALFQALKPGDHVIIGQHMYWALRNQAKGFCTHWGIALSMVDILDLDEISAAMKSETKLLLAEAPSNPMMVMPDIPALAKLCSASDVSLAVDATAATPILLRPLLLGADLVFHSTTKSLNGHSDILGGVITTKDCNSGYWQSIKALRAGLGSMPSAFDTWLLARGLRTAALRVKQASANAQELAQRLSHHPGVSQALYPSLEGTPGQAAAVRDFDQGYGCLLSIRLAGGARAALKVLSSLQLFIRATSLGGTESLVEYRAPIEGPTSPVPDDLLRLSVGIEHVEDLWDDLSQALDQAGATQ